MAKYFGDDSMCLFAGGLRRDKPPVKIKGQLTLLFKCIGLHVKKSQIIVINSKNSDYSYSFVDLQDQEAVRFAIHQLGSQKARENINYNFTELQEPNKWLKFDYKWPQKPSTGNKNENGKQSEKEEETSGTFANTIKSLPFSSQSKNVNSAQTSTTGLPLVKKSLGNLPVMERTVNQVSMATSVGGLVPDFPARYYVLRERLGNETRVTEFKEGGFINSERKYILQENVGKYVCAFLNTDGGTLYVGVDNDGQVVGVTCDQQDEDRHRLTIDHAIKSIAPPVLPASYTVNFVPVLDKNNSFDSNLKVLEVKVHDPVDHTDLYIFRGDAFIRRDGSVQMLRTREIQRWEKKKIEKALENHDAVMDKLSQQTEEVQNLQERIIQLQQNQATKNKSRVCSVM